MNAPEHGGDLAWARAQFPAFAGEWLDLSTGVSPFPWPAAALPDDALRRLPSGEGLEALRAAAAAAYGVPGADRVAALPGAQAAIQLLARMRAPCRVAIAGPTYGGHEAAWRGAGHDVVTVDASAMDAGAGAAPPRGCEVAIVVNPNNPDGRITPAAALRAWAPAGGWLIVDESFADTAPEAQLRPLPPGVVALRSFGKFYGLPGLRLGFALAEPELAARIRRAAGPWPVSGPALAIGAAALADAAWADAARRRLDAAARRLDGVLARLGCRALGGTALFRFAAAPAGLFERLGARGVYVRCFAGMPGRLRFGLPPDARAEERLASCADGGEGA